MPTTPLNENLDDLLLDMATAIEPSDADRRVIDVCYRNLKTHLERPSSPLSKYLRDDESRIYSQGSVSYSATIVSGDKDDRFDVDAMVEFEVPAEWPEGKALDVLFEALQGFPNAEKIVRNTRCVTVDFANMHMDVTIMDPQTEPRPERVGEIFHSPEKSDSYRVPANPYGFGKWYRKAVFFQEGIGSFAERISKRRLESHIDRLLTPLTRALDQDKLPAMIPPRVDAQQVVALKLMKRILNVEYARQNVRKPPSVYTTKKSADCGYEPLGLTAQLERLAKCIHGEMTVAIALGSGPDERNPTHHADRLNDRWPQTQEDRQVFKATMEKILQLLEKAKSSGFSEIAKVMDALFGEAISGSAVKRHLARREGSKSATFLKGVGTIIPASIISAPSIAKDVRSIPDHRFHCEMKKDGPWNN